MCSFAPLISRLAKGIVLRCHETIAKVVEKLLTAASDSRR